MPVPEPDVRKPSSYEQPPMQAVAALEPSPFARPIVEIGGTEHLETQEPSGFLTSSGEQFSVSVYETVRMSGGLSTH